MKKSLILFFIFFLTKIHSQEVIKDYPLSNIVEETSGLEIIGDLLITHNDSGGEASLYYLSKKGKILKKEKLNLPQIRTGKISQKIVSIYIFLIPETTTTTEEILKYTKFQLMKKVKKKIKLFHLITQNKNHLK